MFYDSVIPRETVEIFYEGNNTFFMTPESLDSFIFTRDEKGIIDGMKYFNMEGSYDDFVKRRT